MDKLSFLHLEGNDTHMFGPISGWSPKACVHRKMRMNVFNLYKLISERIPIFNLFHEGFLRMKKTSVRSYHEDYFIHNHAAWMQRNIWIGWNVFCEILFGVRPFCYTYWNWVKKYYFFICALFVGTASSIVLRGTQMFVTAKPVRSGETCIMRWPIVPW